MRVFIDADGCPVVKIAVSLCRQTSTQCLILCDTAHCIEYEGVQTLVFDQGADSVDFALENLVKEYEVVITQDYGLASMCLAKKARVIHQDGFEYTSQNIDALLTVRHESAKIRRSGGRMRGAKKRTTEQDSAFSTFFLSFLQDNT